MNASPQRILVTGAAGFIGSHVASALLDRGDHVIGLDNFDPYYDRAIKETNVERTTARAQATDQYRLVEADICDLSAMTRLFDEHSPDAVIHLAARAGVRPSIANPVEWSRVNVLGTTILLDQAKRVGCKRFILASSSSVYGNNDKVPFAETDPVEEPISPYASTKRCCELLAYTHHSLTHMPTACLRFFTVYGPGQRPDLAIAKFMNLMAANQPITMYGDGSMSRDYTYIDDIVSGVLAALERIDHFGYRIWNLGSDKPVRLDELIEQIAQVTNITPTIQRAPVFAGDVKQTWADLSRSNAELDYHPTTPRHEGLKAQWQTICAAMKNASQASESNSDIAK